MKAYFTIDELKVLKGPDRLLRMRVRFSWIIDAEQSLYALFEIINSVLWRNHKMTCNLEVDMFSSFFKKDTTSKYSINYGDFFSGELALDLLIRKSKKAEFGFSYYPSDMEFESKLCSPSDHIAA